MGLGDQKRQRPRTRHQASPARGFDAHESRIRQIISGRVQRGNLQVQLNLVRPAAPPKVRIDTALLAAMQASLVEAGLAQRGAAPDLGALMGIRGVVMVDEPAEDTTITSHLEPIFASLDLAVMQLIGMRSFEGTQLVDALLTRIERIEALTARADALPGRRAEAVQARLAAQLAALIGDPGGLDPARLHQEAVLIAAKADIREELDRLKAHSAAARALIGAGGPVGRKLDFLSQEFVREANTLCAKSNDVELTAIGLDLKAIIEQLREQVQNIE